MAINKTKWGALACGLCCALCVALYLASVRGEVDAARAEALERYGGDQVEVCVAKRDLAAGEVVDASAVVTKMWVADLLPDTAVTDSSQIIGRRLGSNVIKGEVLCFRRTEVSDSELAVPAGMAAISVPARPVQAVGGSVEPGMEVDVYATGPVSTTKLVGGALVLATSAASESGATAEWVTLAVEPERVQEVVAAAQNLELRATRLGWQHAIGRFDGRGGSRSGASGAGGGRAVGFGGDACGGPRRRGAFRFWATGGA